MASFIFGGNTGETQESLKRKRDIAEMLARGSLGHAPRNVGEGLSAIGDALAYRILENKAKKAEAIGHSSANAAMASLAENIGGSPSDFLAAPGMPGAASAATPAAPTDMPSERVASAFAASGGGIPDSYYDAIRSAESGGSDTAKNPLSSATGRYQFTRGTWDGLMTAHPELGLTPDGRTDPAQQERAIRAFTAQNAGQLQKAGIPINGGDLYAAHFLGADGAKNVLTQPDNALVSAYVSPQVIASNPFLKNMSVGQFKQWAASKGGGSASAATGAAPPLPAPVNVPDMPVAAQPAQQPVQVAQAANAGTPGQMSDANALALLGASPVHPGQGNSIADLLRTASNPWLNKNASAVVNALLGNKLKQQDPGHQLDMRYKQAQLDNLLHPQAKPTSDMQNYEFYSAQEKAAGRQPLSYNDWNLQSKKAGATTINNSVNAGDSFSKQLQKNVADTVLEQRQGAQDAADLIKIINEGRGLLDQGAITGAGANYKVGALKFAGALGIPIPQDAADNTQAFRAVMGQAVGKIIKQFGSGTGLSDSDRKYAERIAGGDVTLNEEAIRRILDIADKAARGRIKAWQQKVPEVLKGDMGSMLNVAEPPAYTPPANATSGQPVRVEREQDYLALPRGAQYVAPDGTVRRKP